jgi:hypothetical protein
VLRGNEAIITPEFVWQKRATDTPQACVQDHELMLEQARCQRRQPFPVILSLQDPAGGWGVRRAGMAHWLNREGHVHESYSIKTKALARNQSPDTKSPQGARKKKSKKNVNQTADANRQISIKRQIRKKR